MDAKLRIDTYEQMHMIGHNFHVFDTGIVLRTDLLDNLLEPHVNSLH